MHGLKRALIGVGFVGVFGLFTQPEASAKANYDSNYGFERTWNAALRLVRVDLGLKITEKDEAGGYLLFDYKSSEAQKPSSGSMEFLRGREPDSPIKVVVQLPQMPHYHEQVLVDSLARKLRAEYGDAPQPRRSPSVPRDAGAEGGSD